MRLVLPASASVALAGAATMALEILLPRRLAPEVGTTSAVWTAGIAVVLTGLALGSALGGRGADADDAPVREARRLALAALLAAVAPFLARAAAGAAPGGVATRAFAGMLAGGFLPCVALGSVYPVAAARALRHARHRGRALGLLAAAGAVGSVLGTWGTSYGLVPWVAVPTAAYAVAGLLALTALGRLGADPAPRASREPAAAPPPRVEPVPLRAPAAWNALVGAVTLAFEVVAARRVALDAGSSLEAWTAIFVVVLAGLSVGGFLGGPWADRAGPRRAAVAALLLSAILGTATAWTSRAVVETRTLAHGFGVRTAIGVAVAYLPLFTALGTLPPILARAAVAGHGDPGRRAGLVSAAGTVGALAGVLVAGPGLVPVLRIEGAAAGLSALLAVLATGLAVRRVLPAVVALAALGLAAVARLDVAPLRAAGLALGVRPDADGAWVADGPYGRVLIERAPEADAYHRDVVRMKLDARTHGIHDLGDPTWIGSKYGTMYDAVARHLRGDRASLRALFLGGGTYTAPRALLRRWPAATVHVAEIDPLVTRAAEARLGLDAPPAGLTWVHEDGRTVVRAGVPTGPDGRPAPWDLVFADAFGDVGVPWHLTTLEFLREVRAVLAPDGVYLANTIDVFETGRFLAASRATLRAAFRHVEAISVGRETGWPWNFVFVASDAPLDLEGLARTDPADPEGPPLPVHVWSPAELDALEARFLAEPLRDDFAPVERLLAPLVERAAPR